MWGDFPDKTDQFQRSTASEQVLNCVLVGRAD
jgi:hypothetical protein